VRPLVGGESFGLSYRSYGGRASDRCGRISRLRPSWRRCGRVLYAGTSLLENASSTLWARPAAPGSLLGRHPAGRAVFMDARVGQVEEAMTMHDAGSARGPRAAGAVVKQARHFMRSWVLVPGSRRPRESRRRRAIGDRLGLALPGGRNRLHSSSPTHGWRHHASGSAGLELGNERLEVAGKEHRNSTCPL